MPFIVKRQKLAMVLLETELKSTPIPTQTFNIKLYVCAFKKLLTVVPKAKLEAQPEHSSMLQMVNSLTVEIVVFQLCFMDSVAPDR